MDDRDWLAEQFEANRARLRAIADRMLGSSAEAEDAVQETWLRLNRSSSSGVQNLGGWLTTVVARVCLDALRSRASRREERLDLGVPEPPETRAGGVDPEHQALLADSVGPALLVVLDALAPAERVAFVLHDVFGVPFDEIAPIVGRSPDAARQLASRARRRVRGAETTPDANATRQREVVRAFLAAARGGDFAGLLAVLDPDAVLRADAAAVRIGATPAARGARAVAETFLGQARAAQLALVNGAVGLVWAPGGRPRVVFQFVLNEGKITQIEMVADPETLTGIGLTVLPRDEISG